MNTTRSRAILVIGDQQPTHALLNHVGQHEEVFVLARAVPDQGSRFLIDSGRAHAAAQRQLANVIDQLRARGSHARGLVGDPDPSAARRDALALFPHATTLLEAA